MALSLVDELALAARGLGLAFGVAAVDGAGREDERRAGRTAAAQALLAIGAKTSVVGRTFDGRPVWPAPWTGSISHAAGVAVAAVTEAGRAVGIDLEVARALPADESAYVLDEEEQAIASGSADAATRLWCAKEAAFKAWSMRLGGLADVDPLDIHIDRLSPLIIRARGRLGDRVGAVGRLLGTSIQSDDWVLTLVVDRLHDRRHRNKRPG